MLPIVVKLDACLSTFSLWLYLSQLQCIEAVLQVLYPSGREGRRGVKICCSHETFPEFFFFFGV